MFALTFQGRVHQVEAAQFPVHSSLTWVDIGANVQGIAAGWGYDGLTFTAPPPEPPAALTLTADALADLLIEKNILTKNDVDGKKK